MSNLEHGPCSPDVYEAGKKHLVALGRLCVGGIYTAMIASREDPLYFMLPVRIKEVTRLSQASLTRLNARNDFMDLLKEGSAQIEFLPDLPELESQKRQVVLPGSGLGQTRSHIIKEMFFKHTFDDTDEAFQELLVFALPPIEIGAEQLLLDNLRC